jgi:hypothetical protein
MATDIRLTLRTFAILFAMLLAARPALSQAIDRATCGVVPDQNLVVFVGKKLDVQPFTPELPTGSVPMDYAFRARYRVLEVLCGDVPTPEVEFEAYDHYGTPAFSRFETVLLFLSHADGRLFHEKYQYSDVYETSNGSWAGCGDPYKLEPEMHRGAIRAKPVTFKHPVTFSIRGLTEEQIRKWYPQDFFQRQDSVVVCRAGAPLSDLFAVKRAGVLKARGLFR